MPVEGSTLELASYTPDVMAQATGRQLAYSLPRDPASLPWYDHPGAKGLSSHRRECGRALRPCGRPQPGGVSGGARSRRSLATGFSWGSRTPAIDESPRSRNSFADARRPPSAGSSLPHSTESVGGRRFISRARGPRCARPTGGGARPGLRASIATTSGPELLTAFPAASFNSDVAAFGQLRRSGRRIRKSPPGRATSWNR